MRKFLNHTLLGNKKTIAFQTFGCKLNFAETSSISKTFTDKNYRKVDFKDKADIYVINSCTVTQNAEKRCKDAIKRAKKINPNAEIALIGCYAQLRPEELESFKQVDYILGNEEKFHLLNYIENPEHSCYTSHEEIKKVGSYNPSYSIDGRTRSFLKVQDGCDYFCTYCAIPFARGNSRSDTIENTIKQAKEIAAQGQKEIILTGVNIGTFGKNHKESFYELLVALEKIVGIERIRTGSIEPNLLTDEIIDLVAQSSKILPHFHIPLQSGNNEMLQAMKRKYPREVFADRVLKVKEKMPLACVAADVIIGFPGETKEYFEDTFEFIDTLPVSYLHVFTYSDRPEAKSSLMIDKISNAEKKNRSQQLHVLGEKKKREFYKTNAQSQHKVLWEAANKNGIMSGLTDNYIPIYTSYTQEKINTIEEVKLEQMNEKGEWKI